MKKIIFLPLLVLLCCCKPGEDKMEDNLIGKWTIEYYDEFTRNSWDQNNFSNGELSVHRELVGEIEFRSNFSGTITDSAYIQNFTWSINEGWLVFNFEPSASANDDHPIVNHYFPYGCDSEVKSYSILRSSVDTHVFRFRNGGSCNLETFHCLEWAITK